MKMEKIKQKLSGIALIIIGIILPFIGGDMTVGIFSIPLGMFLLFTKHQIMDFD